MGPGLGPGLGFLSSLLLATGNPTNANPNPNPNRSTQPLLEALRALSVLPTEQTHGVSVMDLIARTVYCLGAASGVRVRVRARGLVTVRVRVIMFRVRVIRVRCAGPHGPDCVLSGSRLRG